MDGNGWGYNLNTLTAFHHLGLVVTFEQKESGEIQGVVQGDMPLYLEWEDDAINAKALKQLMQQAQQGMERLIKDQERRDALWVATKPKTPRS